MILLIQFIKNFFQEGGNSPNKAIKKKKAFQKLRKLTFVFQLCVKHCAGWFHAIPSNQQTKSAKHLFKI